MSPSESQPPTPGSPKRPLAMTERAEVTRRRLMEAAEEVFAEQGFFRTSIAEITRRAGVAQGTFYIYFKAKEEIFRELVRQMSHDLRRELQEAVAPVEDRRNAERAGFEAFLGFVLRRRNLYTVMRECEFVDPELHKWYYERMAEGYMRGLRQGMARGQIRPLDPQAVAYALMGAFQMLGMRWTLWGGTRPPQEAIDSVISFVLHGLSPAGQPEGSAAPSRGGPGAGPEPVPDP